ncbi:tyrosine-type recombinase/integrase [Pseudoalteromonas shioyasakiensis]|uniref:tyrosine-type recombinase/integrase n=1 Tax=Pseudoalteromonas shioyasakiensis TaxID=1190813 RepID=UPI002551CCE1|nr:tyrosine-type recombinase/integrase [Pseudoalteromonas shioyasakiensis]MDK9685520.1 site-specific integrase [Pseudoalteromonas shioyasakiensis]
MAEVEAIKELDSIKLISHLLEIRCSKQMSDIWNIGLNLALRISDLLSIKFSDIQDDRIVIKEAKTGKQANIKLNNKALKYIRRIQQEHPMRKTRGYHLYRQTKDIGRVMKMLRHGSEGVMLRYIGITQDNIDKDFDELEI